MAQPQRRPSLDSDVEEDPERGKKVRIKVFFKGVFMSENKEFLGTTAIFQKNNNNNNYNKKQNV